MGKDERQGIGCCGLHLNCQFTGECNNPNRGTEYPHCHLYDNTIRHKFSLLYKLKQMDLVKVEDNHLTDKGNILFLDMLKDMPDAKLLIIVIGILGLLTSYRLNVLDLIRELKIIKKGLTKDNS